MGLKVEWLLPFIYHLIEINHAWYKQEGGKHGVEPLQRLLKLSLITCFLLVILIFCADDLINLTIIQFTQSGSQKQLDHLQVVPDEKQILRLTMIANKIYKHYLFLNFYGQVIF